MGKTWAVKNVPRRVKLLAFSVELGHSLVYLHERSGLSSDSVFDLTVASSRAGL